MMQLHELYEAYEAVRHTDGIELSMTPKDEEAWEARLDELEQQILKTEPRTMLDALTTLKMVESALDAGDGEQKAELLVAMISNCRQAIADIYWRQQSDQRDLGATAQRLS